MKIIIIGGGKVGYTLAESLCKENNDVTVIDKNSQLLEHMENNLDVMVIRGNGVRGKILLEAGIEKCDLLIAVTESDEVNMVCCLTAKKLGSCITIARVRDPEYAEELSLIKDQLGLDFVINPEFAAAEEIALSLSFSTAINVERFASGKVRLLDFKVTKDMPILGKKLKDIDEKSVSSVIIGIINRGDEIIVPSGETEILEGDIVYIIGKASKVYSFCKKFGRSPYKIKDSIILGGGRITYYLYKLLREMNIKTKIIEIDKKRCFELSEDLNDATIITAPGSEDELLEENLANMDAFIALTGIDEANLMTSLFAKRIGVKKVITKLSRTNYLNMVYDIGLDTVISPKLITANKILQQVRGSGIETLLQVGDGEVEILEFSVHKSSKFIGKPLRKLDINENTIIATIIRKNEVVVPSGSDFINAGDKIIVITKEKNIATLSQLEDINYGGFQNELRNGIKKLGEFINK